MTETQRKALQAAEDAFRRYADHHAMKGDETKARANMALAGQMSAAQVECVAPVAAQIRHQDEDGQWSEWAGIPLSHAYSNFLPSVQVRLLYEAGQLSPRMTGTDHAAELAHRTCSRYKQDKNPALVEYTFNQHTLGDFVRKLVAAGPNAEKLSDFNAWLANRHPMQFVAVSETMRWPPSEQTVSKPQLHWRKDMTPCQTLTEVMQRMQAGEKLSYTDKEVELIMLGWQSELQKEVAAERDACKLICKEMEAAMTEDALIHPTDSPERDACYARARALMSAADAIAARAAR